MCAYPVNFLRPLPTFLLVFALVFGFFAVESQAQRTDPSDQFLKAYMAARQGEQLEKEGKLEPALARFRAAAALLDEIRDKSPEWQPVVVQYRAARTSESISKLEDRLGVDSPAPPKPGIPPTDALEGPLPDDPGAGPSVSVSPTPSYGFPGTATDILESATREIRERMARIEQELAASKAQVRQLQADKLQMSRQIESSAAQLREATSQLDRTRLAEAEMRSKLSETEKALKQAIATSESALLLEEQVKKIQKELVKTQADREAAEEENEAIASRLSTAQKQISGLGREKEDLTKERDTALAELSKAREAQARMDRLILENEALSKRVTEAEAQVRLLGERPTTGAMDALKLQVATLQVELATAQEESESFQSTLAELRGQLSGANSQLENLKLGTSTAPVDPKITEENRLLREIVTREMRDQARRDQAKKLVLEELAKLETQSDSLLDQIEYLAQPVIKLSNEERALLREGMPELGPETGTTLTLEAAIPKPGRTEPGKQTTPTPSSTTSAETSSPLVEFDTVPPVPTELEPLARQAREMFARKDYRETERLYEQILAKDPKNLYALSNLGVTRFRAGKLKAAELSFKKAIAINPDDSFVHSTLGIVYYRQGRYDDAVNVLTKALTLNPKNAIAHNYLGITASQKGWQEAAEKELQSAIALNPNYADAHFNLAVIYATQEPPSKELARKHYSRATELGTGADATLEGLIR